jgi:hypothetical protein
MKKLCLGLLIFQLCMPAAVLSQVNDTVQVYEAGIKLRVSRFPKKKVLIYNVLAYDKSAALNLKFMSRSYNHLHPEDTLVITTCSHDSSYYRIDEWFAGRKDIKPISEHGVDKVFWGAGEDWEGFYKTYPSYQGIAHVSPVFFNSHYTAAFFICALYVSKCGTGASKSYFLKKDKRGKWQEWNPWLKQGSIEN